MVDGILLGIICYASLILSFMHFPQVIKDFLINNFLITDILSILITFMLLSSISKSLTVVIASLFSGLLINITLIVYKKVRLC